MPALPLTTKLSHPVSAYSLAVFRICFGALLLWDCWRFIRDDRIWRYWIAPEFHFSYPGFSWVTPLPEDLLDLAWLCMGVAALFVMLGLFYRVAIIALTLLFTYFFLVDAAEYLNHFYLILLYALILCFLPAARVWSLDAGAARACDRTVPYAAIFMLRAQTEIVLIYAGLVKLTPDWLAGQPLSIWLRERTEGMWLEQLLQYDGLIVAGSWAVIALHILGAPLLLLHRTRLAVFLIYVAFHLANAWFFNIGIFPWLTIAASTVFFAPHWPIRLLRRPAAPIDHAPSNLPRIALLAMVAWLVVQIFLPLRGAAFDSETGWSGDGHRFSWRMRIYDRQAYGEFIITDRDSREVWRIHPDQFLTPRQTDKMLVRADLVHQFANYLAARWQQAERDVEVRAVICKSLNGRPHQLFIDPDTDLTQVRWNLFGRDDWVLPMDAPDGDACHNPPPT